MTFKELRVGDTFRDSPSEYGETFMRVEDCKKMRIGRPRMRAVCIRSPNPETVGCLVEFRDDDEVEKR
jgi:hypothetical protein